MKEQICLSNVEKTYDTSKFSIKNISFKINECEIFGLVGRNGAGKTTIIKVMVGLLKPDKGNIEIFGKNIEQHINEIKSEIGIMFSEHFFYEYLTGREYLSFIGKIKGLDSQTTLDRIEYFSIHLEFQDVLDRIIIDYSHGTKQKLSFVSQIISYPKILILDEPLNGLDPIIGKKMRILIKELVDLRKMTVIISAHQLEFIEDICDRIAIINNGKIAYCGKTDELRNTNNGFNFEDCVLELLETDV